MISLLGAASGSGGIGHRRGACTGAFQTTIRPKPSLLFALAVAPDFGVDRVLWTMGRIGREYVVRRPVESAVWRVSAHECVVEAPDERTDASHPAMCDIAYRGCNERRMSVDNRAVTQGWSIDRSSYAINRAPRALRSLDRPQCRG
jgi:hypothetical protein